MFLIFNHQITASEKETTHDALTPPSMVHVVFEIESDKYDEAGDLLDKIIYKSRRKWCGKIISNSVQFIFVILLVILSNS